MKKIYRLACYKQAKESDVQRGVRKTIADVCPYKFKEIHEECKHCRWFQIVDETKTVQQKLLDKKGDDRAIFLNDLVELPYDPNEAHKNSE